MKVANVAEMRELDRRAIEEFGIPAEILMENAGGATYFVILKEFGIQNKKFVVFCGSGNNGGDGFVVARKIHSNGGEVKVFLLAKRERYQYPARKNLEVISRFPIDIKEVEAIEGVRSEVFEADAIVEAIFGTGLDRDVDGIYREAIQLINESGKKMFAIDIASRLTMPNGSYIDGKTQRSEAA